MRANCGSADYRPRKSAPGTVISSGAAVEPGRSPHRIQRLGHRAWRVIGVTIWHGRSLRSRTQLSGVARTTRESGEFVKRAPSRTRKGNKARDPRARERAAVVIRAGIAGLAWLFRNRDEGAALIAASASAAVRPAVPQSGDAPRASERGRWRRARGMAGRRGETMGL